jgi:hypothetical protein
MKLDEKNQRICGFVVLALPFLAMLAMIVLNHTNINANTEYRFEIEGYDPRDILKGHYLIFNYKWPEDTKPAMSKSIDCACISGAAEKPDVTFMTCAQAKERRGSCAGVLSVSSWGAGFQPAETLRRYFIPEQYAPMLDRAVRAGTYTFEVGLVPQAGDGGQLKMLYVDGQPLPKFLETLPQDGVEISP